MKPIIFNSRPLITWLSGSMDFLVDRPLNSTLSRSLTSAPDKFLLYKNNFRQTPEGYELEVAVPGLNKKDLKLEVVGQVLTVQGWKQQQNTYGWFTKSKYFQSTQIFEEFLLPEDANATGIRAKCRDGLLKIRIPKLKYENVHKTILVSGAANLETNWWQKLTNTIEAGWKKGKERLRKLKPWSLK